ncbi:hypothetical protein B484DRAFT_406713, partial [Ochromonadaceae sp. CCMP2298]
NAPEESLDYLWAMLTNVTSFPPFFDKLVAQSGEELVDVVCETALQANTPLSVRHALAQIALNLSLRADLSTFLSPKHVASFVAIGKALFASRLGSHQIQMTALITLINFNFYCKEARATTLGTDLIDLFLEAGLEDPKMNVKYAGLLNVISNDESCAYRLLDLGVHSVY